MYEYKIKVKRVIDGDTIDAYIDLGFNVSTTKRIRFHGINTPESRTRDLEEKARGLAAKARLIEMLDDADEIVLLSHGVGKFGRVLGSLTVIKEYDDENTTELDVVATLIDEGHGTPYFGGKR